MLNAPNDRVVAMTAAETLDAKLAAIATAIADARRYEHENHLARHTSRKCARDALRAVGHWRERINAAAQPVTVQCRVAAVAPLSGQPKADKLKSSAGGQPDVVVANRCLSRTA